MRNLVIFGGNLCRDPELKYTSSGTAVCAFTVANNHKWKGADGEKKEEVCYAVCEIWGKRAEVINEYFQKGSRIQVMGRLKFQQWETKDGQKRNALKINVTDFDFIDSAKSNSGGGGSDSPSFPEGAAPNDVNEAEIPF